ncbi:microtubule-associated protein [Salix suchowensis]|nr:microtubule-associated protein [Salix suchowensis]
MVIPLGPGKFYGSTLPRPRIYTDVKHSVERVDPPVPVMDPFLSWANEAHWSMGGLNFNRLRYQGRIEGNTDKLRNNKKIKPNPVPDGQKERNKKRGGSVSPPPAPKVAKKRRFLQLIDEESEEEDQEIEETVKVKRGLARKLVGDFERVAKENHIVKVPEEVRGVGKKSRGGKKDKQSGGESGSEAVSGGIRSSPRLAKRRSS